MRRTAPLIIGGGPAGSAAAIRLAQAGARADLLERSRDAHDPVCGGFLGWDALAVLDTLGLDPWRLGARPIAMLRIVTGRIVAEARLPHQSAGLSRRRLDAALLDRAATLGAAVSRGVTVREIGADVVRLADGAVLQSDSVFLATGKHDVRGASRGADGHRNVGLRTTIAAPADLDGWIELHLLDGGYAGLAMQEDGTANLCLTVDRARLAAVDGSADRLIDSLAGEAPRLIDRVDRRRVGSWSAIAAVPYGWRTATTSPGRFRIGDQAAVIASLAGDGVAIALASGRAAAAHWLDGGSDAAPRFQRDFARRAGRPLGMAERLRLIAQRPAWARPLTQVLGVLPGSLGLAARLTRIGA